MESSAEKRFVELVKKSPKTKAEIVEMEEMGQLFQLELQNMQEPLIRDLLHLGIKVSSVWDLVNTKSSYPEAIAVLGKHLVLNYNIRIKEGIVRALAVKEAKGKFTAELINQYNQSANNKTDESLRWAIGNTLYYTIEKKDAALLFPIVLNKENGRSRDMFIEALGKFKTDEVRTVLKQLVTDGEFGPLVQKLLAKFKS